MLSRELSIIYAMVAMGRSNVTELRIRLRILLIIHLALALLLVAPKDLVY